MSVDRTGGSSDQGPLGIEAVGFLLSQLGLIVARDFQAAIVSTGLDPREFAIVRTIALSDGLTQNAISELLGIPPSSLVTILDHLGSLGILERRTHPRDRRSRTLHLTEHGSEICVKAMGIAMQCEQRICGGLSSEERAELLVLLGRVAERLGARPGVHPGMSIDHDH